MDDVDTEWGSRADNGQGAYAVALSLLAIARAIDRLGNGNAATQMGAIEAFGLHIGEKLDSLTGALSGLGD